MTRKRQVLASKIAFIDPADCGSVVGYYIVRDGSGLLSGEIHLSDCNRKIEWYFSDKPEAIQKIDNAIEVLSDFRRNFAIARVRTKKRGGKK